MDLDCAKSEDGHMCAMSSTLLAERIFLALPVR